MSSLLARLRDALDIDVPRGDAPRRAVALLWGASVRCRAMRQDAAQVARFGRGAPRLFESVVVDPRSISTWISLGEPLWRGSGLVEGGAWDEARLPIETNSTMRYARLRFVDRMSWTDICDHLVTPGVAVPPELMAVARLADPRLPVREAALRRLEWFDELFREVERTRRLQPRSAVAGWRYREHGGICVHVGRAGRPIFGARGNHRFAIARILELERIPAMIGLVHRDVVANWRAATLPTTHG
jgi:hypothetical protein